MNAAADRATAHAVIHAELDRLLDRAPNFGTCRLEVKFHAGEARSLDSTVSFSHLIAALVASNEAGNE